MEAETQKQEGIILDTNVISQAIKYYAVIGAGLGALGVVLLLQLGAGEEGGALIGGLLSMVVLAFAVLSGPLIAAFVGYATARTGIGDLRSRVVNSGIANGIGFAVFGVIVAIILWTGLAVLIESGGDGGAASGDGGSGPIEITKLVTLIVLMVIPNSLVGGGITFFLEGRGGASS